VGGGDRTACRAQRHVDHPAFPRAQSGLLPRRLLRLCSRSVHASLARKLASRICDTQARERLRCRDTRNAHACSVGNPRRSLCGSHWRDRRTDCRTRRLCAYCPVCRRRTRVSCCPRWRGRRARRWTDRCHGLSHQATRGQPRGTWQRWPSPGSARRLTQRARGGHETAVRLPGMTPGLTQRTGPRGCRADAGRRPDENGRPWVVAAFTAMAEYLARRDGWTVP
jgi:hypothetical protein